MATDITKIRNIALVGHGGVGKTSLVEAILFATGTVTRVAGGWPPAGEREPEAVYTVRFAQSDLWGDDAEPGTLSIDLWERYLS